MFYLWFLTIRILYYISLLTDIQREHLAACALIRSHDL